MQKRTNPTYRACFLIAILCGGQTSGLAESKPLELKWPELAPLIQGHRIQLTLDGAQLRGDAVVVREDALVMDVGSASGGKSFQKGSVTIPRESVTLIKLERSRGDGGKKLGTVIGVLSGLVIGGYVTARANGSAGVSIPLFLGLTAGFTVGGYHAGRGIDRRETLIRIVP
jgi:hypothetical protein